MLLCPSLLQITVVTCVFCPTLLCYYCGNVVVAMRRLPAATVAYDPMLKCLFIVVGEELLATREEGYWTTDVENLRVRKTLLTLWSLEMEVG
jgi:hypothetical protein